MRAIERKTSGAGFLNLLIDFTGLFYPHYCLGCHDGLVKGEDLLCTRCLAELPRTNHHLSAENAIYKRLAGRLDLDFASAFLTFRKAGIVQKILHELKYKNKPEMGTKLGKLYGTDLREHGLHERLDLIVPVPLHAARLRTRGYNQSAKFAEGLSEAMGVPWKQTVSVRKESTATQTRKSRQERWQNVSDAFSVAHLDLLQNKRVLLVDDVITTGATLEACELHLLQNGCSKLSIACIAAA